MIFRYANLLIPQLHFAGRHCCCGNCACDGTKIFTDGTVEWITHTVSAGVITVVDHEGPCITYWVNSSAGDQTEKGDGTELDPWININTVFADACIKYICTHQDSPDGCPKVKILVKGTIDYTVDGGSYNYGRNLLFEPWDVATINIDIIKTGTAFAVVSCIGTGWKNTAATATATVNGPRRGFSGCGNSIFNNCTGTALESVATNDSSYGFYVCCGCVFEGCTGTGLSGGSPGYGFGIGFYMCSGFLGFATFHNCTGVGAGNASGGGSLGASGFYDCAGTFDKCNGSSVGAWPAWSSGFALCTSSTFYDCNGTGSGGGFGSTGFVSCTYSIFYNCDGVGYNSDRWEGLGFGYCTTSAFDTCRGTGTSNTGTECGFDGNTSSSFLNCTGTPSGGVCDI